MPTGMQTNRELYSFVTDLAARQRVGQRSLEAYLRTLWGLASAQPNRDSWPLDEFAALLAAAFVEAEPGFDERWRGRSPSPPAASEGFERWQAVILGQIVDLRELGETGMLTNELRYYGLDAPSGTGERWFNFDACSYLEAGTLGAFGGLQAVESEPTRELPTIDWASFVEFLSAGRCYE